MKFSNGWTVLPLFAVLAGCPGDDDTQVMAGDTLVSVDAPAAEDPGMPAAGMPHNGNGMVAQLNPVAGSEVGGEVTLSDRGAETQVMVRLTGGSPGGTHPGHIHSGTCDNIGGVVQALEPVATDATGTGTMTTTVNIPVMSLMDGQHIVVYHQEGGGPPTTCADIPAHVM